MKDFKNKVVIVTGASSGIGEAMAREFAAQGARVVLGARSAEIAAYRGRHPSPGRAGRYCGVDVTDVGECRELIDTYYVSSGDRRAGLQRRAFDARHFRRRDLEVLHRLMDVNFWVRSTAASRPATSSSRTVDCRHPSVALHGCRGARAIRTRSTRGFLETLRIENLKKGLHVMIACPGFRHPTFASRPLRPTARSRAQPRATKRR
ncbi:MAG: SDR family NAD(P)-dependent oxidoreductase [Alistipes onderdonkii]